VAIRRHERRAAIKLTDGIPLSRVGNVRISSPHFARGSSAAMWSVVTITPATSSVGPAR